MNKILLVFIIFFISTATNVYSFGIGFSEDIREINFEPNLEKTITFTVYHRGSQYQTTLHGDFSKYITLSEPVNIDSETDAFTATFKFPKVINERGTHTVYVGIAEVIPESTGFSVGLNVRKTFDIIVPYLGKYISAGFSVPNANIDEEVILQLNAENLGEENINSAKAEYEVFDINNNSIIRLISKEKPIKSRETVDFPVLFNTTGIKAGNYWARAVLFWDGNETQNEASFLIGSMNVKVLNYTQGVRKGVINKFDILVQSGWNSNMNSIYAEAKLQDKDTPVLTFKTLPSSLSAWGIINLTGYLDASNLDSKDYDVEFKLFYDGTESIEKGNITVYTKSNKWPITTILIIITIILFLLVIISFIIIRKKSNKGKQKPKK